MDWRTTIPRHSTSQTKSSSTASRTVTPGFGLGVHRCIGSNLARMSFKTMLSVVLERLTDYRLEPGGAVRYEDIGTINGYKHLPATFAPGTRQGQPLERVIAKWETKLYADATTA